MAKATCSVEDCDRVSLARGWCGMHYSRMMTRGTTDKWSGKHPPSICSESDCEVSVYLRCLCNRHYQRMRIAAADPCTKEGCSRGSHARGLCRAHYSALLITENDPCQIEGCIRTAHAKGLCDAHNKVVRIGRNLPCAVDGCRRPARNRNLCSTHYPQVLKYGSPRPDEFNCGQCGVVVSRAKEGMRSLAMLCRKCQVLNAATHWCMTVDEIAERDGFECVECGELVDMALRRPDVMSPSVDHVIPRARGGLDTPENLGLAHLICNLRKGSRVKEVG